jgi:hypothetical protein
VCTFACRKDSDLYHLPFPVTPDDLLAALRADSRLADLAVKRHNAPKQAFHRLKVRLKREIVTMGCPTVNPMAGPAPGHQAGRRSRPASGRQPSRPGANQPDRHQPGPGAALALVSGRQPQREPPRPGRPPAAAGAGLVAPVRGWPHGGLAGPMACRPLGCGNVRQRKS